MDKPKRKTKTSTAVKNRYNSKTYDYIYVAVKKDVAAAFKKKCLEKGISQAEIIKKAIEAFLNEE